MNRAVSDDDIHNDPGNNDNSNILEKIKSTADRLQDKFNLSIVRSTAPARFFNPTNIRMVVQWKSDKDPSGSGLADGSDLALLWRSRDNRKGRSSIAIPRSASIATGSIYPFEYHPRPTSQIKEVCKNIGRMCTTFPYWDMAFWVAFGYTIGSILFVINGCFAWVPIAFPGTEFPGQTEYGVGITSFIGVLCFQAAAFVAYLEAVNEGSFGGSTMRRFLIGHENEQRDLVDAKLHSFFGHLWPLRDDEHTLRAEALANAVDPEIGWKTKESRERPGSIYPPDREPAAERRGALDFGTGHAETYDYSTFRWFPTWHAFKTHFIRDIGFLACSIQLIGTTIFVVTGVVALPGIMGTLEQWQLNASYWIPLIVASVLFIIASILFTVETQEKWWRPELGVLGWWIGAWAIVGSIGFELCGALGPAYGNSTAVYHSSLSSLWGSAAFLVSSLIQWYEAVEKHPVEILYDEPRLRP